MKKPDFLDLDNDGDKEEPMKSAAKSAKKKKTQTDEGNAFTKKLKDTPKGGTFELGGKKYKDMNPKTTIFQFIKRKQRLKNILPYRNAVRRGAVQYQKELKLNKAVDDFPAQKELLMNQAMPNDKDMEKLMRYQTTIDRQFSKALSDLIVLIDRRKSHIKR